MMGEWRGQWGREGKHWRRRRRVEVETYREMSKQTAWYYSCVPPRDATAHHSSLQRERCLLGKTAGFFCCCVTSMGCFEDFDEKLGKGGVGLSVRVNALDLIKKKVVCLRARR